MKLAVQGYAIPVFLKREVNRREYQGLLKPATSFTSGPVELTIKKQEEFMSASESFYLVLVALLAVLFALTLAAIVIQRSSDEVDLEARKIRFAAATFTGILILFVFTAVVYIADADGERGKEIFEKAVTAMTPLAGVIVGYLFGSRSSRTPTELRKVNERGAAQASGTAQIQP